MKRRQALKKTAYLAPSFWALPTVASFIQGCGKEIQAPEELLVFDSKDLQLVSALADTILPKTTSPSASEVKVPQFLDLLLSEVFDDAYQNRFLQGLHEFDQSCEDARSQSFSKLEPQAQREFLQEIDHQVFAESQDHPFYSGFKQLVVKIYYSSEEGVKQNLNYRPVPGPFQGDVPLSSSDKVMTGNDM